MTPDEKLNQIRELIAHQAEILVQLAAQVTALGELMVASAGSTKDIASGLKAYLEEGDASGED